MIDYGAVRRCHYISITDTYDPLSNRRAFYDAAFALPPAMCECYIENIAVRSPAHFRFMLRSGMMGWCTIMTDTTKWTPEQHVDATRQFALYKEQLRPLIRGADVYHVSERPTASAGTASSISMLMQAADALCIPREQRRATPRVRAQRPGSRSRLRTVVRRRFEPRERRPGSGLDARGPGIESAGAREFGNCLYPPAVTLVEDPRNATP